MHEGQMAEFAIHRDVVDGVALVTVTGDLDLAGAPELRATLAQIIDDGHIAIVLDLAEVHFLDSIGLGVLVGVLHRLRPRDGVLAVACPSPRVSKVFHITQITRALTVHASHADAIAAVKAGRDGASP
jgi:anti-sigma B factor antagonist